MPRNMKAPSSVQDLLGELGLSDDVLMKVPASLPNNQGVEAPNPEPPEDKTMQVGENFPDLMDTFDGLSVDAPMMPDLPFFDDLG